MAVGIGRFTGGLETTTAEDEEHAEDFGDFLPVDDGSALLFPFPEMSTEAAALVGAGDVFLLLTSASSATSAVFF